MLKLVLIGIWTVLVTAGSTYAASFFGLVGQAGDSQLPDQGLDKYTSDLMSVPIIRGGDVEGYLIIELAFMADKALVEEKKIDPQPFMKDAAFQEIFTAETFDVRRLKKPDVENLAKAIAAEANRQLGAEIVKDVLLQQVNYVRREDIRTNWIGGPKSGTEE
jgi:hypothetical protein